VFHLSFRLIAPGNDLANLVQRVRRNGRQPATSTTTTTTTTTTSRIPTLANVHAAMYVPIGGQAPTRGGRATRY